MTDEPLKASYEATPYISLPVPLSHPDHLCVLARLHGLDPAAPAAARVLELGCAAGGNLLPMAAAMPDASFVGVDLSPRQVADGQAAAADLALANVELQAGDVTALTAAETGRFDYIIAHGLYSWVPPAVQAKLLPLLAGLMNPHGVAYVSYNCFPGWHQRQVVRALMRHQAGGPAEPTEQVRQARAILDVLSATYERDDAYARLLREERDKVAALDDAFLLHDLLEVENHPVYFSEFARRAGAAGLQYLTEANIAATRPASFGAQARQILEAQGDVLQREQLIDFWLNRSFRESLLVADRLAPQPALLPAAVRELWLASPLQPDPDADGTGKAGERFFRAPDGGRCGLTDPGAQRALEALGRAWPASLAFADVAELAGTTELAQSLALDLFLRNWLELRPRADDFVLTPGPRPVASAVARWQLRRGDRVTSFRHRAVRIDEPVAHQLLPRLDGRHDRAALAAGLARQQEAGLLPAGTGEPEAALDRALALLARHALLAG